MLNAALYTMGWIASVLLGRAGYLFLPFFIVTILLVLILRQDYRTSLFQYYNDLSLAIFAGITGLILEFIFLIFGVISYPTNTGALFLPPLWIMTLYPLFAMTFNYLLKLVAGNSVLLFFLGFIGGPLSYLAGSRLHAVDIHWPLPWFFLFLGLMWGLYLLLLKHFSHTVQKQLEIILHPKEKISVFYDGKCPICSLEINRLKKQEGCELVKYIDFTEPGSLQNQPLSYEEAMKQIHALDEKGELIKGVDVFQKLYARTSLPFLALLFSIPMLRPILLVGYRVFAKNRLRITGRHENLH